MRMEYDFAPLYHSMIGVDRMADLIANAMKREGDLGYPPYDIEKAGEDGYRISLAAAGFAPDELEITAQSNLLVVVGRKAQDDKARIYLHRGITARNFERRFELADYVVVKRAGYENGVLSIELAREAPEALKPRRIEIGAPDGQPSLRRIDPGKIARRAA